MLSDRFVVVVYFRYTVIVLIYENCEREIPFTCNNIASSLILLLPRSRGFISCKQYRVHVGTLKFEIRRDPIPFLAVNRAKRV